jgi:uncharacterized membrane protein
MGRQLTPMSIQPTEELNNPDELSPARRRRARRMLTQLRADEREIFLEELAHSVSPSVDLFLFAILAGVLIGLGFSLDQNALLIAGALITPRMAPIAGMALAAVSGSPRFFIRMIAALVVALALLGLIAGLSGYLTASLSSGVLLALEHDSFVLIDFGLLLTGAVFMSLSVARSRQVPIVASIAVAYELVLPLGAAVIGVVQGNPDLWQGAILIFGIHLTWAVVASAGTFVALGFRPLTGYSHSIATAIVLIGLVALASAVGLGFSVHATLPTPTITPTFTPTPSGTPTITATLTASASPTISLTPTITPTFTATATPLPPLAIVIQTGDLGGYLRDAPSGDITGFLKEGDEVRIVGDPVEVNGVLWWPVRTADGSVGWLHGALVATATPTLSIERTATPTP